MRQKVCIDEYIILCLSDEKKMYYLAAINMTAMLCRIKESYLIYNK